MRVNKQTFQLALLGLMVAFAITRAYAQSRIAVELPFDFSISDRAFPAGQYSVSSSHGQLSVQDSTGKLVFLGMVNQISGRHVGPTGMVVFHCYDARCFLSEYWTPTRENGSQLQPSHEEAGLAKQEKRTELALLGQRQQR